MHKYSSSSEAFTVADLYILLLNHVLEKPEDTPHGREGFFFGESDEHTFYEVGKAIGDALVAIGKSGNSEPSSLTKEEIQKYMNVSFVVEFGQRGMIENVLNFRVTPCLSAQILVARQTDRGPSGGSPPKPKPTSLTVSYRR